MTTTAGWTVLSSTDNYAMYAEVPFNTDAAISGAGNITTATPVSISDVIISKKNQENDQLMTLTFRIVQIVCLSLILIFSVIGNSIVCLIVYQKPAMRSSINLLLANLAFSNTLFSIICIPFCIVTLATERWVFSSIGCNVIAIIYNMFTTIAVYVLLAISVDRYMIIVNRRDRLTPQRTRLIIMALWMYALVFSLPPILGWGRYSHPDGWMQCILYDPHNATASLIYTIMQISLMFFLPVLVMVYTYTCILKIVHKNSLRIHIHSQSRDIAQLKLHGIPGMHGSQRFNINMRFKTRAFKTILLLFVAFVACWLPYSLSMMVWGINNTVESRYIPGNIILWLGYTNCVANPAIYCWRIKKFRDACKHMIPATIIRLIPWQISSAAQRRINPSSVYECNDMSSTYAG